MLVGKTISNVFNATSPHRFAFFCGDPLTYGKLLIGKRVESAEAYGMYVDILLNGDTKLTAEDGTVIR